MARKRRLHEHTPDLSGLIEATHSLPAFSLVGFHASSEPPRADVTSLPFDDRAPVAGLFGVTARRRWYAVGMTIQGTARRLDSSEKVGEVHTSMVVTCDGEIASSISSTGDVATGEAGAGTPGYRGPDIPTTTVGTGTPGVPPCQDSSPAGQFVDALHRVMGLPSPGPAPDPAEMVMCLWMDDILGLLSSRGGIDWSTIARIHPAIDSVGADLPMVPPSDETIIEATARSREHINWNRVHERAVRSGVSTAGLEPHEIRWMDATMFARWSLSLLPQVSAVTRILSEEGCSYEAERLSSLADRMRFDDRPLPGAA